MKKLLALILALVMVMGLATVGTNAALVDYDDADDFNFEEAIDVMSAVGVLEGMGNGKFQPSDELTRAQAAKIVAYLNTNNKTAEALVGTGKFSDVPASHWAGGYVDYLSTIGVLAGRSDTVFDPDGKLTVVDFAKMLLVVLGFDPQIEGLVGNDYKIHTTKLAADEGLFTGIEDLAITDVLTREQAAQMALNTVVAPTVEYANKGGSISVNGADINIGASKYNYVTSTIASNGNIYSDTLTDDSTGTGQSRPIIEFGERQYPDLYLYQVTDDFMRPINHWVYDKEEVGKYIDYPALIETYTTAVTGADLFSLLGESKIQRSTIHYAVNGLEFNYVPNSGDYQAYGIDKPNMIAANKVAYGFTGNGVETSVFERGDDIYITSVFTYYFKAADDFNTRTGTVTYDFYTANTNTGDPDEANTSGIAPYFNAPGFAGQTNSSVKLSAEDFPEVKDMEKDDRFLARMSWVDGLHFGEIDLEPEVTEKATVTGFSVSTVNQPYGVAYYSGSVTADGKQLDFARPAFLSSKLRAAGKDNLEPTYDLVFDQYGYVVAAIQNSTPTNYLFLTGVDLSNSKVAAANAKASVVFDDGTVGSITVDLVETNKKISKYTQDAGTDWVEYAELKAPVGHAYNRWFTWTEDNGVYTLTPITNGRTQIVSRFDLSQGNYYTNGDNAASKANRLTINAAHTVLYGDLKNDYVDDADTVEPTASPVKAYFNSNSKIITVITGPTSAEPGETNTPLGINRGIAEVDAVYTGIQGTDVVAFDYMTTSDAQASGDLTGGTVTTTGIENAKALNPFNAAAYTVYDKNNYITRAIVVGENRGANGNYLYATSGVIRQWKEGDFYYWTIRGILNGEYQEVTIKSKWDTTIDNITTEPSFSTGNNANNGFFEVKFDADGNVTSLDKLNVSGTVMRLYNNDNMFAGNEITDTYAAYSTNVMTQSDLTVNGNTLTYKVGGSGGTFQSVGLVVDAGAPIFVVQRYKVESSGEESTVVTECKNLTEAIRELGGSSSKAEDFAGYVAAGLDRSGHYAKWVVIKSLQYVLVDTDKRPIVSNDNPGYTTNNVVDIAGNSANTGEEEEDDTTDDTLGEVEKAIKEKVDATNATVKFYADDFENLIPTLFTASDGKVYVNVADLTGLTLTSYTVTNDAEGITDTYFTGGDIAAIDLTGVYFSASDITVKVYTMGANNTFDDGASGSMTLSGTALETISIGSGEKIDITLQSGKSYVVLITGVQLYVDLDESSGESLGVEHVPCAAFNIALGFTYYPNGTKLGD